jgi:hypothetical protein
MGIAKSWRSAADWLQPLRIMMKPRENTAIEAMMAEFRRRSPWSPWGCSASYWARADITKMAARSAPTTRNSRTIPASFSQSL